MASNALPSSAEAVAFGRQPVVNSPRTSHTYSPLRSHPSRTTASATTTANMRPSTTAAASSSQPSSRDTPPRRPRESLPSVSAPMSTPVSSSVTAPPASNPSASLPSQSQEQSQSQSLQPSADEYDVFSTISDIKPGIIPLLVRMPDGICSQVDVPLNSTVDDLRTNIQAAAAATPDNDITLSFGNEDLSPNSLLLDTNIVDAYQHATTLIQTIANNRLNPDKQAAALDSACAVVESISNGIKDMEALCAAASAPAPPSPTTSGILAQGAAEDERDTPKVIDSEAKMLKSIFSHPSATPAELARGLSRRLPELFPPPAPNNNATHPTANPAAASNQPAHPEQPDLSKQVSSLIIQPSISNIREARRRARDSRAAHLQATPRAPDAHAAGAFTIGNSTNEMLPPPPPPPKADPATAAAARTGTALLSNSGHSTWLEDVMKTWEVDAVRQSGVLAASKDGQELNEYFVGLEAEAQREVDQAEIEAATAPPAAGDSEDGDESDHDDDQLQPETSVQQQPTGITVSQQTGSTDDDGTSAVRRSMANVALSEGSRHENKQPFRPPTASADPVQQMVNARAAAAAMLNDRSNSTSVTPADMAHVGQHPVPPPSSTSHSSTSDLSFRTDSTRVGSTKPPMRVRQATKIAPAPNVGTSIAPAGGPAVANGAIGGPMYAGGGMPVAAGTWTPRSAETGKKRRGRKRKNPELTEEDRALLRKQQNRESAKLSRVRRKVIAAEYEGRLNSLINENTLLRKQVEGLNNRLVYLQSLLTVSVRQDNG